MPTLDEMIIDRNNTIEDIERLEVIVESLSDFITYSGGEDRSELKSKLWLFESLLSQAKKLHERIVAAIEALPPT